MRKGSRRITGTNIHVKIDFGVDTYGRLYGQIGANSGGTDVSFCYGIDAGYEVFVRATAP